MNDDDDVIILNPNSDDDSTVFQTEEERKQLEREILGIDEDDSVINQDLETTIQMTMDNRPYWKKVFG